MTLTFGIISGQKNTFNQLDSAKELKLLKIDTWINSLQNETGFALSEKYALDRATVVLKLGNSISSYPYYMNASRYRFQLFVDNSKYLSSLTLVSPDGIALLSTNPELQGMTFDTEDFFHFGLEKPYNQFAQNDHLTETGNIISTLPIKDTQGSLLGILVACAHSEIINESLIENSGLGLSGKAYLIDQSGRIVSGFNLSSASQTYHSQVIDDILTTHEDGTGIYRDYRGKRVFGVYQWLPELNAAFFVEQDMSEALGLIASNLKANLLITIVMILIASIASVSITQSISRPLEKLTKTASLIASGDLNQEAIVEGNDEIGALAHVFNIMTSRLRDLINSLEDRVEERTLSLRHRASQLETISQISNEINSILDIENLLPRIVEQIQKISHATHVSIFLIDSNTGGLNRVAPNENRSSTSRMISLEGDNLNAQAIRANNHIYIDDVSHFPDLQNGDISSDTQCLLILPLHMGTQIIGTLDVQGGRPNAFSHDEIVVFETLASQIAVAIENARLYNNSRKLAVLEERERLARDLHDSVIQSLYSLRLLSGGWRSVLQNDNSPQVEEYFNTINETIEAASKEMRLLIYELRPSVLEQEGLLGSLHARFDSVEKRAGIKTRLIADEYVDLPIEIEKELYWIALEALNNSLKYAEAKSIEIHIFFQDNSLMMDICDTGKGFSPKYATEQGGLGLKIMAERAEKLQGSLSVNSKLGGGTTVHVKIPLRN